MENYRLPEHLSDKIFEIKVNETGLVLTLVSYFPLQDEEKDEIRRLLGSKFSSGKFHSIFTDVISDEEWIQTRTQIKKRFQDELFDIDRPDS